MKLSFRLAAAFVAFVILGSLALVLWLGFEERRQLREQFAALARTNAEFIRTQNLPFTERTAKSFTSFLGVEVQLWEGSRKDFSIERGTLAERCFPVIFLASWKNGELKSKAGAEAVHFELEPGKHALFFRLEPASTFLANPRSLAILSAFWFLSLALASALARDIVRPLRSLAARMPHIADDSSDSALPETSRTDEIGQLARAYAETRAQLSAERQAREQAERLAALGKMATGLAHEINNPVAAIKLHTQLLEEAEAAATENAPVLRAELDIRLPIILAESAKIESLVSQWMFLARPQPPQTSPCDFAEILAGTVRTLTPAAQHAGVQIVSEVPPGCTVSADRHRLSQAITNVLTNSIHAMSAHGGTLTIRSCARKSADDPGDAKSIPRSHERSYDDGAPCPTFDITFTDAGPGFSAAALASATDLFFSEKEGGMGIGLNVAAGILTAHGGELRISNAPGGGAVVTFVLPACPASPISHPAS